MSYRGEKSYRRKAITDQKDVRCISNAGMMELVDIADLKTNLSRFFDPKIKNHRLRKRSPVLYFRDFDAKMRKSWGVPSVPVFSRNWHTRRHKITVKFIK